MIRKRKMLYRVGNCVKRKQETKIMLCHLQNAGIQLNDSVVSAINAGLKQIRKEKFEEHRKTSGIKTQVCMQKTRAHEGG